jgi:hypothetical protein
VDDIVKALTIKITADDLTGGAWSTVGNHMKSALNIATSLNQAWELGAKAYGVLTASLDKPIKMLSEGGEYSEIAAGFTAMAQTYGRDGVKIRDTIREISDGMMGLAEATQAASYAIKDGFNAKQIESIWTFAKKYSDVVGGNFEEIASKLEKGIFSGQVKKINAEFGLAIEKGQSVMQVMAQLDEKTRKMGDGAFNFGDSLGGMIQSSYDASLAIKRVVNDLVGSAGFGRMASEFRRVMRTIEDDAQYIGTAIFRPIFDAGQILADSMIALTLDVNDTMFSKVDTLQIKIESIIGMIGNSMYDLANIAYVIWNTTFGKIFDEVIRGAAAMLAKVQEIALKMPKRILNLSMSDEEIEQMKAQMQLMQSVAERPFALANLPDLNSKQEAFNKSLHEMATSHEKASKAAEDHGKSIRRVGESIEEFSSKAEKARKQYDTFGGIVQYGGIAPTKTTAGGASVYEFDSSGKIKSGPGYDPKMAAGGTTRSETAIKVQVDGKDGALKDLISEIIERITVKAVAEGVIRAGV